MSVSLDTVRQYTLGRQGLLERQARPLTDFGLLHATDHTTPYLSLLARIPDFRWESLADAWYDDAAFARMRCVRDTIHMVPADYADTMQCIYNWHEDTPNPEFDEYGISLDEAFEIRFHVTEVLQAEGAQSPASIKKFLPESLIIPHVNKRNHQITSLAPVMRWMWRLGLLTSGGGVVDWRKKDGAFKITAEPPLFCEADERAQATIDLCRWYFDLYGPASFDDWAWWSGLKSAEAQAAFDGIATEIDEITVDGIRQTLYLLNADRDALAAAPNEPVEMVRLLPYEDALLKAYKDTRYRFYDDEGLAEEIAFTQYGEAEPTIMADGKIVGVWSFNKKPNEPMTAEPFLQITKAFRRRLKDEIEMLKNFVEASHIIWST